MAPPHLRGSQSGRMMSHRGHVERSPSAVGPHNLVLEEQTGVPSHQRELEVLSGWAGLRPHGDRPASAPPVDRAGDFELAPGTPMPPHPDVAARAAQIRKLKQDMRAVKAMPEQAAHTGRPPPPHGAERLRCEILMRMPKAKGKLLICFL